MSSKHYLPNYQLLYKIANNNNATVSLYKNPEGKPVIVKKFRLNQDSYKLYSNESKTLLKLNHPNIVKLLQLVNIKYGEKGEDDSGYIIMEYCEGDN